MRFLTVAVHAALLLTVALQPAHAIKSIDPSEITESKVTLLDVSENGAAAKSFSAATIIGAPIDKLCAQLQRYADYPAFMPNTDSVKISQSAPTHSVIDVTLKLPMGKIKKYRLKMEPKVTPTSCVLAWKLVSWPGLKQEETIADTTGQWQLTPSAVAGKTLVRYDVRTEPGPIPFGFGWIVDSLSKDSIPQTLEALRKRAAASN
ncbi:MAG: hypothetical protein ABIT83_22455 [Massilia sp.]